ncbi:MAG TPA: serine protease [Proteobacteria bacterium]|nr:serine protease [Pseudomonadota bacterium]
MEEILYVEDVIVPLIAIPENAANKFRFLGTGFYIDEKGYLITCRHITDAVNENERLFTYQLGKRRELELKLINRSTQYDISLCKSDPSEVENPWPFFDAPYINIGSDVEVYGYFHEPLGPKELPFRQRYMKGYISGISRETSYPDSYELNFPILFGMSGSPLVCHIPIEGENKRQTGIVGCVYGSRESEVVHYTVISSENYEERVSRIVELGLSYMPKALFSVFEGSGINIRIFS